MALKQRELTNVPRETLGIDADGLLFGLTDTQLLKIRDAIDEKLGIGTLEDLDISKELVVQLTRLKTMQQQAMDDSEAPHGQKAQAAMTVSRLLQDLTKCRTALNNAEISKRYDAMVIDCMRTVPEEAKDAFFTQLERYQASLPTLVSLLPVASTLPDLPDLTDESS